jgi:phosphoribosylaminoimidazole-succinocarboxamide synthase
MKTLSREGVKEMEKRKQIYEGKAKKVYETDNPDLLIQEFKDDATAFDATKRGTIKSKGVINNKISKILFELLESKGIETHFVKNLDERNMLMKRVEIIPLEVTIRNTVAGGMARLLNIEEGRVLAEPVLEYHYKDDSLHDPLINEYHAKALKLVTDKELDFIKEKSFKINDILKAYFDGKNLDLIDFKLEFGRHKGKVLLADEISPDTCRFWDKKTREKLDKDRFRRDLGNVEEAYQEVLKRIIS